MGSRMVYMVLGDLHHFCDPQKNHFYGSSLKQNQIKLDVVAQSCNLSTLGA